MIYIKGGTALLRTLGLVPQGRLEMAEIILTPREKLLLRRLARGMSDHDIAQEIGGTEKQIIEQKARLIGKLGVTMGAGVTEAAARLARWPKPS